MAVLSAAALTTAFIRVGVAPTAAVVVSATSIGVMWTVPTVFPGLLTRRGALWRFSADKTAIDLIGIRVPTRRYGFRRTPMPLFTVRLGTNDSTLLIVDYDGRRTDLVTTDCRFELACTRAGRIVGGAVVKRQQRAEIDASGRLSVSSGALPNQVLRSSRDH